MKFWHPRKEESTIKRVTVVRQLGGIGDVL